MSPGEGRRPGGGYAGVSPAAGRRPADPPAWTPALLFFFSIAEAGWVSLAPNLEPRQEVAVAAAAGKVYLIGGIRAGGPLGAESSNTVEVYDPTTNGWSFVASLPEPLHHPAAATYNDEIYVFGGYRTLLFDATDAAYKYEPANNSWLPIARMPSPRAAHAAVTIGNRVYIVGGVGPGATTTLSYEPQSNAWSILAPLPTPREHLAGVAIGGKLYAAGGRIGSNLSLNHLHEYDPIANVWRSRAPLPTGRSGIAAAALLGRLYVFGGEGNRADPRGIYPQVESYDPVTDTWRSEEPMPTGRHGIGAAVIGRTIYVPGGATQQGFGVTSAHEAFVLPSRSRAVRR